MKCPDEPVSGKLGDLPDTNPLREPPLPQFTSLRSPLMSSDSDSHSQHSSTMDDDRRTREAEEPMPAWLPQLVAAMQAALIRQQQPAAAPPQTADTNSLLVELVARLAEGQQQLAEGQQLQAAQFAAIQQTLAQPRQVQERQPQPEIPNRPAYDFQLKATDVGKFEPRGSHDPVATQQFNDNITYSVRIYGEDTTRAVLQRCCEAPEAQR